jgi:2-dehydro-3-deoxygluconokinase
MMPFDLVTFGEAMIRLTSPGHMRLEQARVLEMSVGGAEWNVAANVARMGLAAAWVSRLVDNWTGRLIAAESRRHGVDVSAVQWVPFDGVGRVRNGFYHLEIGAGPRASAVTYDRGHSAISLMTPGMIDWSKVLAGSRWLHVSGVTPSLSEGLAEVVVVAFETAGRLGVRTSYDLNYRGKLWKPDKAQAVTARIMPHVQVLIGNEEDFDKCLGLSSGAGGGDYSQLDPEGYKQTARQVVKQYPNVQVVGTTLRNAKTGLLNDWRTLVFDGRGFHLSRVYENLELVDRVGGGDSFSSAIIHGLLNGTPLDQANELAAAYSALAHTFPGDVNWATLDEARKAMAGGSARISR